MTAFWRSWHRDFIVQHAASQNFPYKHPPQPRRPERANADSSSWQRNIHASLFLNTYDYLSKVSELEDIDAVMKAYFPDQATAYTQAIASRLESKKALVPALWQLELANVLKTACTRGKLSLDAARKILDTLSTLPIEVETRPAPGKRQLFELAMRYKLSSYDATYLELAMRHGLPIATQDAQLKDAALAAGIVILQNCYYYYSSLCNRYGD